MILVKWAFILFAITTVISSCGYEELSENKNQTITIVSDYLSDRDSLLFIDFTKKTKVKVRIIQLNSDTILKRISKDPLMNGFDCIMVSDLDVLNQLDRLHLLQKISSESAPLKNNNNYRLTGLDPLVYYANRNLNPDSVNYTDLSTVFWYSNLEETQLMRLFNCIKKNNQWTSRESAFWLHQAGLNRINYPATDSLAPRIYDIKFLSPSERAKLQKDSVDVFQYVFFPDQNQSGLLYNYYAAGIIYQSPNYTAAMEFMRYLTEGSQAKRINDKLGLITLDGKTQTGYYKDKRFILNPNSIDNFPFDLKWWNAHLSYAKGMKIESIIPKERKNSTQDSIVVEN